MLQHYYRQPSHLNKYLWLTFDLTLSIKIENLGKSLCLSPIYKAINTLTLFYLIFRFIKIFGSFLLLKRSAPLDRLSIGKSFSSKYFFIFYFISEEFSLKLFWFWFSLGLSSLFYWNSRPSLEFISSFIFMLKFKFEIFKISQYLLRQLSMTHCSTINNIEVLFIKFTYICISL